MWIHSVYFWLDRKLDASERLRFREALHSLRAIPSVRQIWIGPPAPANRPAVDRTYDFALTIVFENGLGHEEYQTHSLHKSFVQSFSSSWLKFVVYDHEEK